MRIIFNFKKISKKKITIKNKNSKIINKIKN